MKIRRVAAAPFALALALAGGAAAGLPIDILDEGWPRASAPVPVQGLEIEWDPREGRGPLLQPLGFAPEHALRLEPWSLGRGDRTLVSLPEVQAEPPVGPTLRWRMNDWCEQRFELGQEGLSWTLVVAAPVPGDPADGAAWLQLALPEDAVVVVDEAAGLVHGLGPEGWRSPVRLTGLRAADGAGRVVPLTVTASRGEWWGSRPSLRIGWADAEVELPLRISARIVGEDAWLEPAARGEAYGRLVVPAGDVDGDGHADLLVAARFADSAAGADAGRVALHLGSPGGPSFDPDWTLTGTVPDAELGASLAGAGDFDGDGLDDLLVGEPGAGRVLLFRGAAGGYEGEPAWSHEAARPDTELGRSLAFAGDVNGDGFDDLLVGESRANGAAGLEAGRVLLFLGGADGPAASPDQVLEGEQAYSRFGAALAGAGDFDGDGRHDVVIGAPLHDQSLDDDGRVTLHLGTAAGLEAAGRRLDSELSAGGRCGEAVAGLGDLDGDGLADLGFGCPGAGPGRVEILFGPDASERASLSGRDEGEAFGSALAGGADWDGDGRPEVAVGAPRREDSRGVATLHSFDGRVAEPLPLLSRLGEEPVTEAGMSVALIGDADRDGFGELAIGQWYATGALGWAQGRVALVAGRGRAPSTRAAAVLTPPGPSRALGEQLSPAGDVNGDGYPDLLGCWREGPAAAGDAGVWLGGPLGFSGPPDWRAPLLLDGSEELTCAGAGDVNGDGHDDLLFGGPAWDSWSPDAGGLALVLGGPNGPAPAAEWQWSRRLAGAEAGAALFALGDVNGDGLADFASWARGLDEVAVFRGRESWSPNLLPDRSFTSAPMRFEADGPRAAGPGDLDGDGFDDLLVVRADGFVTAHHGGPDGPPQAADWVSAITHRGAWRLGDLDGDGFPEFGLGPVHSVDLRTGGERAEREPPGGPVVLTGEPAALGDVDGDGRDDLAVTNRGAWADWRVELLRGSASGLVDRRVAWSREEAAGGRPELAAVTGLDANGDGLSDLVLGLPGAWATQSGLVELHFGSSGQGSRRAPLLTSDAAPDRPLRPGAQLSDDERVRVEFGLDVPGARQPLRIEWSARGRTGSVVSATLPDSGPPPGALPAPGARGFAEFALEPGLLRPRYRLAGSEPVPWTSPWYRLPRTGGSAELRVEENLPPDCGFTVEELGPARLLLRSTARDPNGGPLELSWSAAQCGAPLLWEDGPDESSTVLELLGCSGTCVVRLRAEDATGLATTCSSSVSWGRLGVDAGPDRVLDCGAERVALEGLVRWADPGAALDVRWEPATLVSRPDELLTEALGPGTYTLTVTDPADGCTESDSIVVEEQPGTFEVTARVVEAISCSSSTATVAAVVEPPGDHDYAWLPAFAVSDPSAPVTTTATPGVLTVEVTDRATGCTRGASVEIVDLTQSEVSGPEARPLTVARREGRLELEWEDSGAGTFAAYRGSLAALAAGGYDHSTIGACGLAEARASVSVPPVDSYYLVAAACGSGPRALGRDSRLALRAQPVEDCP